MAKNTKSNKLITKARKIRMLLLDVDGVLTDGKIYLSDDGRETKRFDLHDGHGIKLLHRAGIRVGIISGRTSPSVDIRARQLSIQEIHQGVVDKIKAYEEILHRHQLKEEEVAYIGDDLVDLPLLRRVGLSVVVANAHDAVKRDADWITKRKGGGGAVREVVDYLLKAQGKWSELIET
jgi:3-deoxy-D-manno-octulosonate 8-phosphate phosphatase (KDO 8-P phosphatase)